MNIFKKLLGGDPKGPKKAQPPKEEDEGENELIDPRVVAVPRRGGVDIRRSQSEFGGESEFPQACLPPLPLLLLRFGRYFPGIGGSMFPYESTFLFFQMFRVIGWRQTGSWGAPEATLWVSGRRVLTSHK
jgi:hypothetical protein